MIFAVSAIPIACGIISHWVSAWNAAGLNPKDWSVMLASAGALPFTKVLALGIAILVYVFGMILGIQAVWQSIDQTDDDSQSLHSFLAFVGAVGLTVHFWTQASDSRMHVAMVAGCVIAPFVPLVRGSMASIASGVLLAYIMVVPGWFCGWTAGSVAGWCFQSHPTHQATQSTQPVPAETSSHPDLAPSPRSAPADGGSDTDRIIKQIEQHH